MGIQFFLQKKITEKGGSRNAHIFGVSKILRTMCKVTYGNVELELYMGLLPYES